MRSKFGTWQEPSAANKPVIGANVVKKGFGMFLSARKFREAVIDIIREFLLAHMQEWVLSLDPKKHYILIVPDDLPVDELKQSFEAFHGKYNLVVLQAKGVKLLEME